MVHVMVKVKYPQHKAEEFLKFYLSGKEILIFLI